jgi:hypothetical protein
MNEETNHARLWRVSVVRRRAIGGRSKQEEHTDHLVAKEVCGVGGIKEVSEKGCNTIRWRLHIGQQRYKAEW